MSGEFHEGHIWDHGEYRLMRSVGTTSLACACEACRRSLDGLPDPMPSAVSLPICGVDAYVDPGTLRVLAGIDPAERMLGGIYVIARLSHASRWRRAFVQLARDNERGEAVAVTLRQLCALSSRVSETRRQMSHERRAETQHAVRGQVEVIPVAEAMRAIAEAIDAGEVAAADKSRSALRIVREIDAVGAPAPVAWSMRNHFLNKSKPYVTNFRLRIGMRGETRTMRLDHALALFKRARTMPTDAYGNEVLGIVRGEDVQGAGSMGQRHWTVAYGVDMQKMIVRREDTGNIDHVYPQSLGGETRLVNLQMMKLYDNSCKSSAVMPDVTGEPAASAMAVTRLWRGVRRAYREGRMESGMYEILSHMCRCEIGACVADLAFGRSAAIRRAARREARGAC